MTRTMTTFAMCLLPAAMAAAAEAPSIAVSRSGGGETLHLGVAELQKMVVRDRDVTDPHAQKRAHYRGVALASVLAKVGAPLGSALRGPALASHVEVRAADGYRVAFSLAELDPDTGSTDVLVAFERDGAPLTGEMGPFRLVVPTDKRGARWIRQVASIRVIEEPAAP